MGPEASSTRWYPFSVLVMNKGEQELIRVPTRGHFERVQEMVRVGTYRLYRNETLGVLTLEKQLENVQQKYASHE